MREVGNYIHIMFIDIGKCLNWLVGGYDSMIYALLIFTVLDYVTNVMRVVINRKMFNEVGIRVICRKIMIFLLVIAANILDIQVIGNGSFLRTIVILFYISNEEISLLENAAYLGLPIPAELRDMLEQLHNSAKNGYRKDATKDD